MKAQLEKADTNVVVVDGTWHMPMWKRDAKAEHQRCRVKDAVYFDLDEAKDKSNPLPHMRPPPDQFEAYASKLGISNDSHVVIYDNNEQFGMFSAARVWWLFHTMGHQMLSILDGGLPKWKEAGGVTEEGPFREPTPTAYKANPLPGTVRSFEEMLTNMSSKKELVVDGRAAGRFQGTAPEPNPKIPSGHMVGAVNIPFTQFFKPDSHTMKDLDGLREESKANGVDLSKPVSVMCGSGMTACWPIFTAHLCSQEIPLYDGSWTEWQKKAPEEMKTPGVKGEDLSK